MKKLTSIFLPLLLITACGKDEMEVLTNPPNELSFEFQLINSDNQQVYQVRSSEITARTSAWSGDEKVWLRKGVRFKLQAENGRELEVQLKIQGREDHEHLLLYDEDLNHWLRNWDFISTDREINNLWDAENANINITINGSHLLERSEFHLLKVQKALVDGDEKTYVKFSFSGEAYGAYDGYKEREDFAITNGVFEGYID